MEITSKLKWNTWEEINWKAVEFQVFKLQKRIYRASLQGDKKLVHKLQRMMVSSYYGKLLATRKVTQENKGKKTAGVDGVKALKPKERLKLAKNLKLDGKSQPTRRVWIPKPGKKQRRPLGIPTILERVKQTLLKLALEPEWEAVFEPNSYGFRPGRSCHDAIAAIFASINKKPKYVLDADISKCFDCINHQALLRKIKTFSLASRQIKAWLKSGVIDFSNWAERKGYNSTSEGTPQGGSISPLLANIALHGLEKHIENKFPNDEKGRWIDSWKIYRKQFQSPRLIRYADDFVILCEELEPINKCKELVKDWLEKIGLELNTSKTRIAHTLKTFNDEQAGFQFLGFEIRQFKVGKHHSGKTTRKKLLGFKTIIRPSKEKVKTHYDNLNQWCDKMKAVNAAALIKQLNPIIRGWCNYQSPWHSSKSFSKVKNLMWSRLWRWAKRRHPHKNRKWIANKYFGGSRQWSFVYRSGENSLELLCHTNFPASVKWVKVEGTRTPYDGDALYWSKRIGDSYQTIDPQKSRLLKKQKGKCAHCGASFKPSDQMEKHHIIKRSKGGNNADKNLLLVHLYCHDQIHSRKVDTTN
ncbi:group II intron reverse transcriptase/maturase [Mastigocoleus testarum]|uniref:Group II intron reverse transcriptase/maturase n=1 Tax=Mastigocoleus testarum BC008 TaxID=371196 RepID=A0A0V7ZLA0_9CYAN|nr:group II intron reverse transcriptase/maturase [Mastigocoleus testarum]KST65166.1 group II intron reverse transcriptase/maturase [Mastigocoleus testarum BC008]